MLLRQVLKIEAAENDNGAVFHKLIRQVIEKEKPVFGLTKARVIFLGSAEEALDKEKRP
jgi:hypothetical protein